MSSFKKDLQELLDNCLLYIEKAQTTTHTDNQSYTVIEDAIQYLGERIKNIPTEDSLPLSEIEQLAGALKCLITYHELTAGKYAKWADSYEAFSSPKKHKDLLDKILAIRQEQINRFVVLYNALPKPERKAYKALTKALKRYPKMLDSAKQWQSNTNKVIEVNEQIAILSAAFKALNINNGEYDLILITEKKIIEINALINKFKTFKTQLEVLPSQFDKLKKTVIKYICNNHIELLTLALERTTKKLVDPKIQPTPHEDHNYVLKTIKGDLFKAPQKNAKKEPLIADNDALQGSLGDCYLIASLIGLAKKCPDIIRNAINEKKQGDKVIYEVTLFFLDDKDKKKLVPQKIVIDNQFMVKSDHSTAYASKGDQGELWVLVIEKAMAKALGGYKALAGGNTNWTLRMLAGEFPKSNEIAQDDNKANPPRKGTSKNEIIDLLKNNQGKLITVAIGKPKDVKNLFTVKEVENATTESHYIDFGKYTIYCNHAYVVEAVDYAKLDSAGDKDAVITLHNPHNTADSNKKFPKVSPLVLKHCATKIVAL